ncbi:MAG TPA: Gfo/Idh/MocA family oxidoreductase [Vicinamibacterales bacterium]|nr:Gfo/Idh/MocA family oxidoreductase [Vicinamibacterales bacterium]
MKIRVAVIGVGALGQHHARILAALPDVDLAGIVDIDESRAREIAGLVNAPWVTSAAGIVGRVDAVTIAVPTESHLSVALPFLQRGTAVLVEKPLARDLREAQQMLDAAAASGAVFGVGHTERYNPAVSAVRPLLDHPRFIEVHRLGTFPDRSLDIDVVFDLMIHDLDVVLSIVPSEVVAVEAVGVAVLTPKPDIANARLKFASGCIANITASRISKDRIRKIRIFQRDAYLSVDYAAQEIERWRLVKGDGARPVIEGGKLEVTQEEPLKRELVDFVAAVREKRAPGVTGADGMRALVLARRITEAMDSGLSTVD